LDLLCVTTIVQYVFYRLILYTVAAYDNNSFLRLLL